jgi:hypothetical protein
MCRWFASASDTFCVCLATIIMFFDTKVADDIDPKKSSIEEVEHIITGFTESDPKHQGL